MVGGAVQRISRASILSRKKNSPCHVQRSVAVPSSPHPPPSEALADPQRIVDTLHEPLLVLGEDLTVRQVNPAFYEAFATTPDLTIGLMSSRNSVQTGYLPA